MSAELFELCGSPEERSLFFPILQLNPRQSFMRQSGNNLSWELIHSTRMMLKTLLIVVLLGCVKCQENQSMTPEEKIVIRSRYHSLYLQSLGHLSNGMLRTYVSLCFPFYRDQIVEMFDHAYGSYMVRCLLLCKNLYDCIHIRI